MELEEPIPRTVGELDENPRALTLDLLKAAAEEVPEASPWAPERELNAVASDVPEALPTARMIDLETPDADEEPSLAPMDRLKGLPGSTVPSGSGMGTTRGSSTPRFINSLIDFTAPRLRNRVEGRIV